MLRRTRFAEYVPGLEWLVLLRQLWTGDEAAIQARIDAVARVARMLHQPLLSGGTEAAELPVRDAYAAWAGTYDELPNAGIRVEQPVVRALAVRALALTHCREIGPPIAESARVVAAGGSVVLSDAHPLAVLLGGQAMFRTADGSRGLVANHYHPDSSYIAAFSAARLAVRRGVEPTFGREAVALLTDTWSIGADAARVALIGFPAALVWGLKRP